MLCNLQEVIGLFEEGEPSNTQHMVLGGIILAAAAALAQDGPELAHRRLACKSYKVQTC
jgi:hypothetical protein